MTLQARSTVLIANWAACTLERQKRIERYAAALAALPKVETTK
jgi:hypothetical protein